MKYFSMFTGIGGFELGIKQAYETDILIRNGKTKTQESKEPEQSVESASTSNESKGNISNNISTGNSREISCVGFSEIDKYASQLLQIKWPETKNYGDATKIDERQLPDFDLLVGGFPCQSFSIAGKRKGFDDTRGTLFFDIARILAYKKPKNVLLENVKGLLSHDGGRTFQTIIGVLTDLGYFVEWQVLNSKNFGVPQNRERVFIVGHLGGEPRRKVFPVGKDDKVVIKQTNTQTANTLTANYWKGPAANRPIIQVNQPTHSNDRVYGEEGISPTLNTMQGGMRQPKVLRVSGDRGKQKQYLSNEVGTLSANPMSDNIPRLVNNASIRRLTPLECERLQGFPDNWTAGFSDTQRYKMCGNAVTVNVVQYVISLLLK